MASAILKIPPGVLAARRRSRLLSVFAAVAAGIAIFIQAAGNQKATLAAGIAATLLGAYACFWMWLHPKVYLGKGVALLSFLVSLILAYESASLIFQRYLWERLFQLNGPTVVFTEQEEGWSIRPPARWGHEAQGSTGVTNHIFKPSKMSPPMFIMVARQTGAGTSDLDVIIEGYFRNLPDRDKVQIVEKTEFETAQGFPAVRLIYIENAERFALKNEVIFITQGGRLFVLTTSAAPHWFDRHRENIDKILQSFSIAV